MNDGFAEETHEGARTVWRQFRETIDPARPALARYCRRLTGDVWDAEDLVHDTLLRAFGLLGTTGYGFANPQAYLLRTATNIWIDAQRRRLLEAQLLSDSALAPEHHAPASQEQSAQIRDAGRALLQYLAPQERAAVVLKDVFDMSLDETASVLGTTSGAVKSALSRGRGRLAEIARDTARPAPSKDVIDRFIACYNARDLDGLLKLMLDDASIEMQPVVSEIGRPAFTREGGWFSHGTNPGAPRVHRQQRMDFRAEPIVVQLTAIKGRELVTSVMRLDTIDDRIARIRSYTFCPDAVREVAAALGLETGPLFYSFKLFFEAWQPGGAFGL